MKSKGLMAVCLVGLATITALGFGFAATANPQDEGDIDIEVVDVDGANLPDPDQIEFGPESFSSGETPAWELQEHSRRDTASYVFNVPYSEANPFGGFQGFGTTDKVGVDATVNSGHPTRGGDFAHIGAQKASREVFLASAAHELSDADRKWNVMIWSVHTVADEQRYVVTVDIGKDLTQPGADGRSQQKLAPTIYEIWRLEDGQVPTLVERTLDGIVATDGKTTAEIETEPEN